jgi:hypothetical protein
MPETETRTTDTRTTAAPPPPFPVMAATSDFYQDQSEKNALNAKRTFDEFQDIGLAAARRSQSHFDELSRIGVDSLNESVMLSKKVHAEYMAGSQGTRVKLAQIDAMRARHSDMWAYEQAYDLGNPVTTGVGDDVRAGAVPANRITDTTGAVAGGAISAAAAMSALNNVSIQLGELTALVQEQNATNTTLLQTLSDSNASIASSLAKLAAKA